MEINEDILIRYIDGMLTEEEAVEVKNWRAASLENEKLLEQVYFTAQVASRLKVMRTVNPDEALSRFKSRIHKKEKRLALRQVLGVIQRAAAVLFIPVFLLSAYLFIQQGQGNVRTLLGLVVFLGNMLGSRILGWFRHSIYLTVLRFG